MSVEIKSAFLSDLSSALSDKVTASALQTVLSSVSDVLEHYEFSRMLRTDVSGSLDLFDAWIAALRVQGRSEKTIQAYTYIVTRVLSDIKTPVRSVTVHHIRNWLAQEKSRGIADSTLEGNRQVLASMFGWLYREGLIEKNPVANIGTIKAQRKVREPYADVDLENLKTACKSKRDLAILCFLLATGCRISEATGLDRNQIDFTNNEVTVLGKGNKERIVYFDAVTAMHLRNYLSTRTDGNQALFIGKRQERLQPGGVRAMLNVLAEKAGVNHAHPHRFRRTRATMLIAHGMPIQEVANILGHEKLDTTMRYVTLDKASLKNDYKRYA